MKKKLMLIWILFFLLCSGVVKAQDTPEPVDDGTFAIEVTVESAPGPPPPPGNTPGGNFSGTFSITVKIVYYEWSSWSNWWVMSYAPLDFLPPTDFNITTHNSTALNLSFTKSVNATHTYIERATSPNWELGSGSFVYNDTGSTYQDSGLNVGTTYYYQAWGYNSTVNLFTNTNASAYGCTSPGNVTSLQVSDYGLETITLIWTKGTNATRTVIKYSNYSYPTDPDLNQTAYNYTGTTIEVTGLEINTTYYFSAWSFNSCGNYSEGYITVNQTTLATADAPYNLVATTNNESVISLTWNKGAESDSTVIRMRNGVYPTLITGSEVYNDTGTSTIIENLNPVNTYYFRAWGWNGETFSASYSQHYNTTFPEPPINFTGILDDTTLTITWVKGDGAVRTVIRNETDDYPSSPTSGYHVYNDTGTQTVISDVTTIDFYTGWSYCLINGSSIYSVSQNMLWGGLEINAYEENNPHINITNYTVFIKNQDGSETFINTSANNPFRIAVENVPHGEDIAIQVSKTGFNPAIKYYDLYENYWYRINFYLSSTTIEDGGGGDLDGDGTDCTLRAYTDSISVTNPAVDAVIPLSHTMEELISVELYNKSLYDTYGGWIYVPSDKFTNYSTNVTISNSILDVNTTMVRVSYYYEYCAGEVITVPIYYIRIIETYETSSGTFEKPIEDAKVDFQRYINTTGSYESISILLTDANGYVNLYLIPEQIYQVVTTKEGYITDISDYIPQPPNIYGQTTEKTFRITPEETPDIVIPDIYMDALVLAPYDINNMWIYYLNLNEDNSWVNFTVYDYIGDTLLGYYNISSYPNNVSIYFNFSSYNLSGDMLKVVATAARTNGTIYVTTEYFNIQQAGKMRYPTNAPIAAILSIGICLFGLTIAHPKKTFGFVGIVVMIIAIGITAFADQTWYIHFIQAIELILLIFIFLVFKEEGAHAV